jgi:hypothetical protein
MEETPVKSTRSFKWLFAAVPLTAMLLLAVLSVWQFSPDKNPSIVQKTLEPLTAKQVFAAAVKNIANTQDLEHDQVRYIKVLQEYIAHDSKGHNDPKTPCSKGKVYTELYTNSAGQEIMRRMSNAEGVLFWSYPTAYGNDGNPLPMKSEQIYFDQAISDRSNQQITCPVYDYPDVIDKNTEGYDWKTATTNEDREDQTILEDLMSGVLSRQKNALMTLQKSEHYTIAQHQRIDNYQGEVIKLSKYDNTYWYQAYFFDQSTKKYIGLQRHEQTEIIVEQGVRPASQAE